MEEAKNDGASIPVGGACEGTMFQPTVVTDTKPGMRVDCEEIFAPVITVSAYDDFGEAIARAKGGSYSNLFEVGEFSGTQDAGSICTGRL